MKNISIITFLSFYSLFSQGVTFPSEPPQFEEGTTNLIDGYALLQNQSDHSNITITFTRTAPSALTETVSTIASGYFSVQLEDGIYDITYTIDGFFPESLSDIAIYSNTTLSNLTLLERTTLIHVPSLFSTIEEAAERAFEGDTILIAEGQYNLNSEISIKKNYVTIASNYIFSKNYEDVKNTIIYGNNNRGIAIDGPDNIHIAGLTIKNCYDGAIFFRFSNYNTISYCILTENTGERAAGIYVYDWSNVDVRNTIISNNTASGCAWNDCGGGAITVWSGSATLTNCIIDANESKGGAVYGFNAQSLSIVNSIVSNNIDSDSNTNYSIQNITNTISYSNFFNNEFPNNNDLYGNNVTTNLNNDPSDAYYNIQINPQFVDADNGDYNIQENSPCIDAGDPNLPYDPDGSISDMGALPSDFGTRIPILHNVPENYLTIQSALSAAGTGDTVLVQPGIYTENIIWPETNGIKLVSAGDSSNTVIDGYGVSSVIYMNPQSATVDTTTLIQGFKITNGGNVNSGGGMIIINSSPKIESTKFLNNQAITEGGTLFISSSNLHINNVIIEGSSLTNSSYDAKGGGIYISSSNPKINNLVIQNSSLPGSVSGGGIYSYDTSIENVRITNITGTKNGGGIYLYAPTTYNNAFIKNCTFSFTNSWSLGHAIYMGPTSMDVYNCSFNNYEQELVWNDNDCIVYRGKIKKCLFFDNNQYAALDYAFIDSSIFSKSTVGPLFYTGMPLEITNSVFSQIQQPITQYYNYDSQTTFDNCTFDNNNILFNTNDANWHFSNCNFIQNGSANNSNSISPISAINNYWGHSSGPYHPTQNPTGQGDSVNAFINVTPWLTNPNTDAPPIPAQNTTLTGSGNDFISLSWDASELGDLAGYKVYYDTDESGYPYQNSINVGNVTSYNLSGLQLGTTYYLAVTTYDTDGNESWFSNEVSGVTRVLEAQNLDIGIDEDLLHLTNHEPFISFQYFDSMSEVQTSYQVQVSTLEDFSTVDMWDTGEVTSTDTSLTYAGATLLDGITYYLRAKVGSGTFYSEWAILTFRMNSTITMSSLTFDPELGENGVYTEGFPTMSSAPTDPEGDNVSVFYYLSDNTTFSTYLDSALVSFDNVNQESVSWQPSIDPVDNQQYWVKAKGWDGYEYGNETTVYTFVINNANDTPASFALLTPEDESEVTTLTPLLDWLPSQDPDPLDTVRYTLYLDTPEPGVITFSLDTMSIYQISENLSDNTTYYWKVIAEDLSGATMENTGGFHSFRVNTTNDPPGEFELLAPEHNSMITDLTPTFHWEVPLDPDDRSRSIVSYDVYVGEDDTFNGVNPDMVTTNEYTPSNDLIEDMVYYWKVIATDDDGGTKSSGTRSFWTNSENSTPEEFILLTPLPNDDAGLFPTFTWTQSSDNDLEDVINYHLYFGDDLSYLEYVEVGEQLLYSVSNPLNDNTNYYWYVVAMDLSGATFTTNTQTFAVNAINDNPSDFNLLMPANGSILNDDNLLFVWSPATDLDNDDLQFEVFLNGTSIGNTSHNYFPFTDVVENEVYEWFVVSTDGNGGTSTTDTWSFTLNMENTAPSSFDLISPLTETVFNQSTVTIEWEQSNDIDPNDFVTYDVVLSSGVNIVTYETNQTTFTIENMLDNTIFHWFVNASDQNGAVTSNNGGHKTFTINISNDPPTIATLIAPLNGSIQTNLRPGFHWAESIDPDPHDQVTYILHYEENDAVITIPIDTNYHELETDMADNSAYSWSVKSMDINGSEITSEIFNFYTDAFPEPPLNFATIEPEDDIAGLGTEVLFMWNSTEDPDPLEELTYRLIYATDWNDHATHVTTDLSQDTSVALFLTDNTQYTWMVEAVDGDGFTVESDQGIPKSFVVGTLSIDDANIPKEFALFQNHPNPFNPTTKIKYDLPISSHVNLVIYDVMGRSIRLLYNDIQSPGQHSVYWDATNNLGDPVSAGMYIYSIVTEEFIHTKKMVLLK